MKQTDAAEDGHQKVELDKRRRRFEQNEEEEVKAEPSRHCGC